MCCAIEKANDGVRESIALSSTESQVAGVAKMDAINESLAFTIENIQVTYDSRFLH